MFLPERLYTSVKKSQKHKGRGLFCSVEKGSNDREMAKN